jgi:hypothetical protein
MALAALLAGQQTSEAATILAVDFGLNTAPSTEAGFESFVLSNGGNSNVTQTYPGLSGVASGSITLTLTAASGRDRGQPTTGASPALYRDLFTALNETTTDTTFSLSGLDPSTAYNIEIWSLDRGFNSGATYTWVDTTVPGSPVTIGTITNNTSATPASLSEFRVAATVTADASGVLRFGHNDSAGTGTINGFRISAVPEPGSLGLAAAAGGLLLGRRRRADR